MYVIENIPKIYFIYTVLYGKSYGIALYINNSAII